MTTDTFMSKSPGDQYKGKKRRKRRMVSFKIHEISSVTAGAQEGATATILKRRPEDNEEVEKLVLLTTSEGDHQHAVRIDRWDVKDGGGSTSYNGGTSEDSHSHPYVIGPDGSITIGETNGHTHTVDPNGLVSMIQLQLAVQKETPEPDEAPTVLEKIETAGTFVAGDYALVPDPTDPSTWGLRLVRKSGSNPDRRLVGNAVTALKRDRVPHDERATVIRRTREAWTKSHVGASRSDMPSVLKRASVN